MTEPLKPSTPVSIPPGLESSSQRVQVVNEYDGVRMVGFPQPVAANIPNILKNLSRDSKNEERRARREADYGRYVEAERRQNAKIAYARSGCPERHRRDLELTSTEWLEKRDKIIGQLGDGFLIALLGKRGPGKTQLAEQAIKAACNGGIGWPLYVRAMTIFLDLRATYGTDENEQSVIERYSKPSFLAIDELQERGNTAWEDRVLAHLIDIRYGDMKDTLLIANLTPDAFEESMGASITERLRETGGIIECTWESFRK